MWQIKLVRKPKSVRKPLCMTRKKSLCVRERQRKLKKKQALDVKKISCISWSACKRAEIGIEQKNGLNCKTWPAWSRSKVRRQALVILSGYKTQSPSRRCNRSEAGLRSGCAELCEQRHSPGEFGFEHLTIARIGAKIFFLWSP